MKKTFQWMLVAILFVSMCVIFAFSGGMTAHAAEEQNDGSASQPHKLTNSEDFITLSNEVNSGSDKNGIYYVLTNDIVLDGSFSPIGTAGRPFQGNFDGAGFTITLALNGEGYIGLFGSIGTSGSVRSVTVDGSVTGTNYVGGIVGSNNGLVADCINMATVSAKSIISTFTGGLSGENGKNGIIVDCINTGSIVAATYGGGITGRNCGAVDSAVNMGKISAKGGGSARIGGLIGENDGRIANSYNNASVEASGDRIGSIIGYLASFASDGGYVYNNIDVTSRDLVGISDITPPKTLAHKTKVNFLAGEVMFAPGSLMQAEFDEGYGYLHAPESAATSQTLKQLFRTSLFESGDGSETTPFSLSTYETWTLFAVNSKLFQYQDMYVQLSRDILLFSTQIIGSATKPFEGSFDGKGFQVDYQADAGDYVGLFSKIGTHGSVKNMSVIAEARGGNFVGGLAGFSAGKIDNVTVTGEISGSEYAGGIVGSSTGIIDNCANKAKVSATRFVGGIAGRAVQSGGINLTNYGAIFMKVSASSAYFGGVFGSFQSEIGFTASNFVNFGEVSAYRADYTGGLVGYAENAKFVTAVNVANVSGRKYVGGLIGSTNFLNITNGMAVGTVSGASNVGGINGSVTNESGHSVSQVYFSGRLGEVADSTVDRSTFYAICNPLVAVDGGFYNNDLILNFKGIGNGKNIIELTDGTTFLSGDDWIFSAREEGFGFLPILNIPSMTENTAYLNQFIKLEYFSGGHGTEQSPYRIADEQIFRNFVFLVNNYSEYASLHYAQNANLVFTRPHTQAGTSGHAFSGVYNGNNFTIRQLVSEGGLFAVLATGGQVKQLGIASGTVASVNTDTVVGSLVDVVQTGALVQNCYSLAVVSGTNVGGLVGKNYGTTESSFFAGTLNGVKSGGGIANDNAGIIRNCFVSAVLSADSVGGVAAQNNNGTILGCVVSGALKGSEKAGGFVASSDGGTIRDGFVLSEFYCTAVGGTPYYGGVAGTVKNTTLLNIFYNKTIATNITCAYYDNNNTPVSDSNYQKSTEDMRNPSFVLSFSNGGLFVSNLTRDKDGDFAPRNGAFVNTGNPIIEQLSAQSVKLRLYGRDSLSTAVWGSAENPYLIEDGSMLRTLSSQVTGNGQQFYDYSGNTFRLTGDISMGLDKFEPIGRYESQTGARNRVFNGVFDGWGFTISNLAVDKTAVFPYVAMFGYTGFDFRVKNLILDASCSFMTLGKNAASFVGYNRGTIVNCISYAHVSASDGEGGIAAFSSSGTEIRNTVFAGTLASAPNAYGLVSSVAGAVDVNTTNSWFILENPSEISTVPGKESYTHNYYGSVVHVDRGGDFALTKNVVGGNLSWQFTWRSQSNYFRPFLMTSNNGVLCDFGAVQAYDPLQNANVANGDAVIYYARVCQYAEATFGDVGDNLLGDKKYGKGYYYYGQTVKFTFLLSDNAYLSYSPSDYDSLNLQTKNEGDGIVLQFSMPKNESGNTISAPIVLAKTDGIITLFFDATNGKDIYDGTEKTLNTEIHDATFLFKTDYFLGNTLTKVNAIKDAGEYTVKVRLTNGGQNFVCGSAVIKVTVRRAEITLATSDAYWAETVGRKVYDGVAQKRMELTDLSKYHGIISADLSNLTIGATVTFENSTAGTGKKAVIASFVLSGVRSSNYYISADAKIELNNAVIDPKKVTVTVADNDLIFVYTANMPSVKNVIVSSSLGTARLEFSFMRLKEGAPDSEWGNLTIKVWNVGSYMLSVTATDRVNYELSLADSYILQIEPKLVDKINYQGMNGLVYTGQVLSDGIMATYNTVGGNPDRVTLTYRSNKTDNVTDRLTDAGSYTVLPLLNNENYRLSGEAAAGVEVNVARSASGGKIQFGLDADTVTIGGKIKINIVSDLYGGDLILEKIDSGRGNAMVAEENGEYFIVPTKYALDNRLTFRLKSVDSPNYEDRLGDETSITITPGVIYVGLAEDSRTVVYGNIPSITLVYSFNSDLSDRIADLTKIDGFRAPSYNIVNPNLQAGKTYEVNLQGGDSHGYKVQPADKVAVSIGVVKRALTIVVVEENNNSKIYGEPDGALNFTVLDGETGDRIENLPNGKKLELQGALARKIGETVGLYPIDAGTLNDENNVNYEIKHQFYSDFTIEKRPIRLQIAGAEKLYGMSDPVLTVVAVDGYGFAYNDTVKDIHIELSRSTGEDVGEYAYLPAEFNGGQNYTIENVDRETNKFVIRPGTPSLTFNVQGDLRYGDKLSEELILAGNAFYNGKKVEGKLTWLDPAYSPSNVGTDLTQVRFIPQSGNFLSVSAWTELSVMPRIADISYTGIFHYTYNGTRQCEVNATVRNPVGSDTVKMETSVDGNAIDAGVYRFHVTIGDERYTTVTGKDSVNFTIHPAIVTVNLEDFEMKEGESYRAKISYSGFVNGDDESVLSTKARVVGVPTEPGYYSVYATGAESKNYTFDYKTASLLIHRIRLVTDNLQINGLFSPDIKVNSSVLPTNGMNFSANAQTIDKALKHNLFIPNSQFMKHYLEVRFSENVTGEIVYTVNVDYVVGDKIYLVMKDGSVTELKEYELISDTKKMTTDGNEVDTTSKTVSLQFSAGQIAGVAVYADKELRALLIGYIPLAAAAGGLVLIVTILIIVGVLKIKNKQRKESYNRRFTK